MTDRQTISHVVDLVVPPTRVRTFMDDKLTNHDCEHKVSQIKEQLLVIRKEGYPISKPVAPEAPARNAKEVIKNKYKSDRTLYLEQLKKYNEYTSDRYTRLEVLYRYCKNLKKLHNLLQKEDLSPSLTIELQQITAALNDKPRSKLEKEEQTEYDKYVTEFKPKGYLAVRGANAQFDSVEGVQKEMDRVMHHNKDIELFFHKDEASKDRVRFNDPAAVVIATFAEVAVGQLMESAVNNLLQTDKHTLQPDNCVNDDTEKCSLYSLVCRLPRYTQVVRRQKRYEEWTTARQTAKARFVQQSRLQSRYKDKKDKKKVGFTYESFSETEVKNGFATKQETTTTNKNGKELTRTQYDWYGLDVEESPSDVDFEYCITKLWKRTQDELISFGNTDVDAVHMSYKFKKFLSDIILDIIARVMPLVQEIMELTGQNTVNEKVIMTVMKMILIDGNNSSLSEAHQELVHLVNGKIISYREYQTGEVIEDEPQEQEQDEEETSATLKAQTKAKKPKEQSQSQSEKETKKTETPKKEEKAEIPKVEKTEKSEKVANAGKKPKATATGTNQAMSV